MRLFTVILFLVLLTVCKKDESLSGPESIVLGADSVQLYGCTDDTNSVRVGYIRGCAIVSEYGRRIPGDHEYGPIPADSVTLGRWFVRWGFFRNVSRIQASLCKFDSRLDDYACAWNWVTFTNRGPISTAFEPESTGVIVQRRGDWAAYFNLRDPGKFLIILRAENDFDGVIADTMRVEINGSEVDSSNRSRSEIRVVSTNLTP